MSDTIFILNGPNLNLLGTREPEIYGRETLEDMASACRAQAERHGFAVDFRQSNHEGELIDALHEAHASGAKAVIFNPGGYTHTSIALRDAVAAITPPVIEVHLSQTAARESFRHVSHVGAAAIGTVTGLGLAGYLLAIDAVAYRLDILRPQQKASNA